MTATPTPSTDAGQALQQVQVLLDQQGRQWRKLVLIEGLCITAAAALGYFLVAVCLDSLLHLPMFGRVVTAAGLLGCVAGIGWWQWRRWRELQPDAQGVALAVERNTVGGVQNRLINALQIGNDPRYQHHDLAHAVVHHNWRELRTMPLRQARILQPAILGGASAGAVFLAIVGLWILQPAIFATSASRILLPLASIDPFYRTTLQVQPGDIRLTESQLTLTIAVRGDAIDRITILRNIEGRRDSIAVPVPARAAQVTYTLTAIDRDFDYAVRGGDFTSRFYHVQVPRPVRVQRLTAQVRFPDYINQPVREIITAGELEALRGSRVSLRFELDQKVGTAAMIAVNHAGVETRTPLSIRSGNLAEAEITMGEQMEYRIETEQAGIGVRSTRPMVLRVLEDQPPRVELAGLGDRREVSVDEPLNLTAHASDDYGVARLELVLRQEGPPSPSSKVEPAPWKVVDGWTPGNEADVKKAVALSMMQLQVAEADRVQMASRARDRDPGKGEQWCYSPMQSFIVGGLGVALQLTYEQILASEGELAKLTAQQQELVAALRHWLEQLKPESGVNWDDPATVKQLHAAARQLAESQRQRKQWAGEAARQMVEDAGAMRMSLGMIADTELERVVRIMEAIQERDTRSGFSAALNDAQTTATRIVDSLTDLQRQYERFRRSWELAHMIAYTKMVADRQQSLAESSQRFGGDKAGSRDAEGWRRGSMSRRQARLAELRDLAQAATHWLGREGTDQPVLKAAFAKAGVALADAKLAEVMNEARKHAEAGSWLAAVTAQAAAATTLASIHADLRAAQTEAARAAMAALTGSDAQAQQDIGELLPGSFEQLLSGDPDSVPMEEIIRMHKLAEEAKKKHELDADDKFADGYQWDESMKGLLYGGMPPEPDFDILKLADKPGGQRSFPESSDLEGNKIELSLLEGQFEDLVGDLLEEADDMRDRFETYNLNAQGQGVEEGNIGKQAGDINSVSAAAATGNQKPPTHNFGGASRTGRGGARAHGLVVGNESINRRGRDQAQEGQERVADQAGELREVMSDDPMKDTSTGVGGKKVQSDDTAFSIKDSGKWTDDILGRMDKAQKIQKIVERQDGSFSAAMAEQMRDLASDQEQMIQRLKTLRKDLKNVYLPTDHIDQAIAELAANMDALKQSPDAEVFRRQVMALDRLRASLRVFRPAGSDFQPSIPRQQQIRGRIVDDAPRPPSSDYDQAVKQYYELLAQP